MMSCRGVDPVLRIELIGACAKDFCPALAYSVVVFWLQITSGLNTFIYERYIYLTFLFM